MNEGFKMRIKYGIYGRLAYLSHLETIRSVERIIRRAELPFAITEGFSPHMKIAFGPALPVGAGSAGEYVDVRLREYMAADEALARLQAAAPPNLMPLECFYIGADEDAITVAFPTSVWRAEFAGGMDAHAACEGLRDAFDQLLAVGYIEVVKKKGRKLQTKQVSFEGRLVAGPDFSVEGNHVVVAFTTFQGSNGALRPDKFIDAALAYMQRPASLVALTRVGLPKRLSFNFLRDVRIVEIQIRMH